MNNNILKSINYIAFLILLFFSFFFIFVDNGNRYSIIVLSIFAYISFTSLYGIFISIDRRPFSLNKTYNIFFFLFLGLAPALQFKTEVVFFDSILLSKLDFIKSSSIIAISHTLYLFIYRFFLLKKELLLKKTLNYNFKEITFKKVLIISFLSLIVFLILVCFDCEVIFNRPPNHWQKDHTRFGLVGYSILLIIRTIPLLCLLIYELSFQEKKILYRFILLILVFLIAFPFSLGRAVMGYYYIPLLMIYLPFFKRKLSYSLSFIGAILFAFPVFNFFRPNGTIDLGFKQFLTPHFDAFSNFSFLIRENIITYGEQLIGSMLFFVPSSKWQSKSVGTGQMLAEKLNFSYTNISMPFWGEGYANFGYLGILIVVIFLALLNAFFDKNYWQGNFNTNFKIIFLFLLGFEFYLLRGDLYSSVKLSVSYLLALLIIIGFFYFTRKLTKKKSI